MFVDTMAILCGLSPHPTRRAIGYGLYCGLATIFSSTFGLINVIIVGFIASPPSFDRRARNFPYIFRWRVTHLSTIFNP
jgi:hypothetical protein